MRPALQRLLSRASSLELLQYLTGRPIGHDSIQPRRSRQCELTRRDYTSAAVAVAVGSYDESTSTNNEPEPRGLTRKRFSKAQERDTTQEKSSKPSTLYGQWDIKLLGASRLDFESDLTIEAPSKLLNPDQSKHDVKLWGFLLDYRYRKYGIAGVRMFWDAVRSRNVQLPTASALANQMWYTFLVLGFEDHDILEEICQYADDLFETHNARWKKLYVTVVQHFLLNGAREQAVRWHERLMSKHPSDPRSFAEMCASALLRRGNDQALQKIYQANNHHNTYRKVIGVLCRQEDFATAMKWHKFLLKQGDIPDSAVAVNPLVQHLAAYDIRTASKVTKSLVDAGVPISEGLDTNLKISREMMNIIHGEHFKIKPKTYDDKLGARWFATRWVSLDVAINAIHALGVQEIGPLSLQAIALREPDPKDLAGRIEQLKDLGISLGDSVYSRAVVKFSHNREYENLASLLQSDQHPDAFENSQLQENLLSIYADNKDWVQYRRTLAMQNLRGRSPEIAKANLVLRLHARRRDSKALQNALELMQQGGIPVSGLSMFTIVQSFCQPRQVGRKPVSTNTNDIHFVIYILRRLAFTGSRVPPTVWREIVRRLGMLGALQQLEKLCLFLASWYSPNSKTTPATTKIHQRLDTQLPTSHPLHPLRIIFPPRLQKALVEWGFIHVLNGTPTGRSKGQVNVTFGLLLLQKLFINNVDVDMKAVKKALVHRLTIYYGPGYSTKKYNRRAIMNLRLRYGRSEESYRQITKQIEATLGADAFRRLDLPQLDRLRSGEMLRKVEKRQQKAYARL